MLIIGIAGGSGSGKTTVVRALTGQLKENVVVIPQDSYYKDMSHASEEEKRNHNFDHPDSIDFELLRAQIMELKEGNGFSSKDDSIEEIIKSVDILQEKLNCRYIMTTLSERGVLIKDYATSTCHHIPAHLRKIADVSGAGDTVLSVAMLCLACNQNAYNIAAVSNLAGGIVCEEEGVIPINKEHLFEESKKIS